MKSPDINSSIEPCAQEPPKAPPHPKITREKILLAADLVNECLGFVRMSAESAQLSIAQEDWKGMAYHASRMICYVRTLTKCADDIAEFNRELPGDKVPNYRREDGE